AQSMPGTADRLRIVPAALGDDVLTRGAAEVGFRDLLRDPAAVARERTDAAAAARGHADTTNAPEHDRDVAVEEARTA
ncbi:MAG: transcriptional regulator, partial [Curtobacterium sp.]